MKVFIGHISALQLLINCGTPMRHIFGASKGVLLKPSRAKPQTGSRPSWKTIKDLGLPEGILSEKLHVNVATRKDRSQSESIVSHVWTGPERGTYLKADDVYYVMTPEACFAQMAADLPLPHLLELGFMLCGTYAPAPEGQATRYDVPPLTTPKQIQAYLDRLEQKNGLANAIIAAGLLEPGAGSVMEGRIAAIMALSTRRGGMGKPAALNKELKLSAEAKGLGYRDIRRPDFLWEDVGVAMDYDSHEYHDTNEALAVDEERRNELAAVGLKSIVARSHHFKDTAAFEALMGQLYSAADWDPNSTVSELPAKRFELFQTLFGNKQWQPVDIRWSWPQCATDNAISTMCDGAICRRCHAKSRVNSKPHGIQNHRRL